MRRQEKRHLLHGNGILVQPTVVLRCYPKGVLHRITLRSGGRLVLHDCPYEQTSSRAKGQQLYFKLVHGDKTVDLLIPSVVGSCADFLFRWRVSEHFRKNISRSTRGKGSSAMFDTKGKWSSGIVSVNHELEGESYVEIETTSLVSRFNERLKKGRNLSGQQRRNFLVKAGLAEAAYTVLYRIGYTTDGIYQTISGPTSEFKKEHRGTKLEAVAQRVAKILDPYKWKRGEC